MKNCKRVISLLAIVVLAVMYFTAPAQAITETPTNGSCGEDLTWVRDIRAGTLTISGEGEMEAFSYDYYWDENCPYAPWLSSDVQFVEIKEGVTSVGSAAFFEECTGLTFVSLPSTLTKIGWAAFYNCVSLSAIELPEGLESIDGGAFAGCKSLTDIRLPSGISCIKTNTFAECTGLKRMVIPAGITEIQDLSFNNCTSLNTIIFNGDAPAIGDGAFQNVTATVYYPSQNETWTEDVQKSYGGNITWKENTITASGTCGENLTWALTRDRTLTISGTGTMEDYAVVKAPWADYRSEIYRLVIEDSVSSIGMFAFSNCSNLCQIDIPDSITAIPNSAFYGCSSLMSARLPDSVTSIGANAFAHCKNLGFAWLGANVTNISKYAFNNCVGLQSVIFTGDAPVIATEAFNGVTATCYYMIDNAGWLPEFMQDYSGSLIWKKWNGRESYIAAGGVYCDNLFWTLDSEGTLTISGTGNMTSHSDVATPWIWYENGYVPSLRVRKVVLEDGVTSIGGWSIEGLSQLAEVEIGTGVSTIGACAFQNCSKLTNVIFHGNAPEIASDAFHGVTATCRYSAVDSTWTTSHLQNYSGALSWVPYYTVTQGANSVVSSANIQPIILQTNADVSKLDSIYISKLELGDVEYTISSENGTIAINLADIDVLWEGIHEVELYFTDGVAVTTLTVFDKISGDVNGDGKVNNKDLTRLFQYLSDWNVEVDDAFLDINNDGKINNKDLTRLFQYLSDWDVEIY